MFLAQLPTILFLLSSTAFGQAAAQLPSHTNSLIPPPFPLTTLNSNVSASQTSTNGESALLNVIWHQKPSQIDRTLRLKISNVLHFRILRPWHSRAQRRGDDGFPRQPSAQSDGYYRYFRPWESEAILFFFQYWGFCQHWWWIWLQASPLSSLLQLESHYRRIRRAGWPTMEQ